MRLFYFYVIRHYFNRIENFVLQKDVTENISEIFPGIAETKQISLNSNLIFGKRKFARNNWKSRNKNRKFKAQIFISLCNFAFSYRDVILKIAFSQIKRKP